MQIKVDLSGLKQTKWSEYAIRFLFGGLVTVFAGVIAKKFGPVIGGLFLAFPAIFPASATLIQKHEEEKKMARHLNGERRGREAVRLDAAGAAIGSLALILFGFTVWRLIPIHSHWLVIAFATAVWAVTAAGLWTIRKRI